MDVEKLVKKVLKKKNVKVDKEKLDELIKLARVEYNRAKSAKLPEDYCINIAKHFLEIEVSKLME